MNRVTVHYFAVLRERRGRTSEELDVEEGTTLGQLYRRLFPPGPHGLVPVAYARNHERTSGTTEVEDGDVVAFLPPLGGG